MTNAKAAEGVAKKEYIPEVTGFVRYNYQNGVPFVVHSIGTVGVHFSYDLFDAGKRRALVCERRDKVSEAEEALERVKDEVSVRMTTIYNKLETTKATAGLLLGDIATAKKDVVRAWMVAKIADPAARVRYEDMYGNGLWNYTDARRRGSAERGLQGCGNTPEAQVLSITMSSLHTLRALPNCI